MLKAWCLVFVVVMLAGAIGWAAGSSAPSCEVGSRYEPLGAHIRVQTDTMWVTIDGSQPSFVRHGWLSGTTCWDEDEAQLMVMDDATRCAFGQEHARFELRLDGQLIQPTVFNSFERAMPPEGQHCSLGPDVSQTAIYIYEFPANYFTPGHHTLDGTWRIIEYPISCLACPDEALAKMEEEGGWAITETTYGMDPLVQHSITLTVLYPP